MTIKHGLGRGLQALIRDEPAAAAENGKQAGVTTVPADQLMRSSVQPRQTFHADGMEELVRSIREKGVIQPLLARKVQDRYELIAGERRLRAAKEAGLATLPVIVIEATDQQALEYALIENLQRENLNPIEEAEGYKALADRFGLTQEQIADRVGKARASVANTMRFLDLPAEVKDYMTANELSPGHAKVLLGVEIQEERLLLAKQVVRENMSVRALERLVEKINRSSRKPRVSRDDIPAAHISHLSDLLRKRFGTGVRLTSCRTLANGKKIKGFLEMDFYSSDDLDRILQVLGVPDKNE